MVGPAIPMVPPLALMEPLAIVGQEPSLESQPKLDTLSGRGCQPGVAQREEGEERQRAGAGQRQQRRQSIAHVSCVCMLGLQTQACHDTALHKCHQCQPLIR